LLSNRHKLSKSLIYSNLMHLLWLFVTDFLFSLKGIIKTLKKNYATSCKENLCALFLQNFTSKIPCESINFAFQCLFLSNSYRSSYIVFVCLFVCFWLQGAWFHFFFLCRCECILLCVQKGHGKD